MVELNRVIHHAAPDGSRKGSGGSAPEPVVGLGGSGDCSPLQLFLQTFLPTPGQCSISCLPRKFPEARGRMMGAPGGCPQGLASEGCLKG